MGSIYIYACVFISNHFTPYFGYMLVFSAENHNALNIWSLTKKRPLVYGFLFFSNEVTYRNEREQKTSYSM